MEPKTVMQISRRVDRGQAEEGQHPPENGDEDAGGDAVSFLYSFSHRRSSEAGPRGKTAVSFPLLLFPSFSFLRGSIHVCSLCSFFSCF
jgi:hypothetical protein